MNNLLVYLRTHNNQDNVERTVRSILSQDDVDFELLIIDDASTDATVSTLRSLQDQRIRIVENRQIQGVAACHNRAIECGDSPFIIFSKCGQALEPEALRRIVDSLRERPRTAQALCLFYVRAPGEELMREHLAEARNRLRLDFDPEADYRREPLRSSRLLRGLRGYRREAVSSVGGFSTARGVNLDYDLSLRLLEQHDISMVSSFLYEVELVKSSRGRLARFVGVDALRLWREDCAAARSALKNGPSYLRQVRAKLYLDLARQFVRAGPSRFLRKAFRACLRTPARLRRKFSKALTAPVYSFAVARLSWWPIQLWTKTKRRDRPEHVVYYLWEYPVHSQTFVQREVAALIQAGVQVHVVSELESTEGFLPDHEAALSPHCLTSSPARKTRIKSLRRRYFRRNPLRYLNLLLYTFAQPHAVEKAFANDVRVFEQALRLAAQAEEIGATRLHSPWADACAFTALIAARLLGIPFSLQARAHDLHRRTYTHGLREKLRNADFVVTNSRYNVEHIRGLVGQNGKVNLHRIYNGVDLTRFPQVTVRPSLQGEVRLLSVARLIEQKGLLELLRALKHLVDRGHVLRCLIIGGPEADCMNYPLEVRQLYADLSLEGVVDFAGTQPFAKVVEAYQQADLFVLPCVLAGDGSRDITPNAVIEAMAMGLPVVSTTVTAVPEIVEDGVSGLLVPPGDDQALANAIEVVLRDDALRLRLGREARRKIERQFQSHINIQEYVRLFGGDAAPASGVGPESPSMAAGSH